MVVVVVAVVVVVDLEVAHGSISISRIFIFHHGADEHGFRVVGLLKQKQSLALSMFRKWFISMACGSTVSGHCLSLDLPALCFDSICFCKTYFEIVLYVVSIGEVS